MGERAAAAGGRPFSVNAAMFIDPPNQPSSPLARWLFGVPGSLLLVAAYLFLGQHHAPWLGEDLRHLLPAWEHASGAFFPAALLHPDLTPWGPLFAWSGALLGRLAEGFGAPFHLGSRLATPIWLAVAALVTATTARILFGRTAGFVAAIAALTSLGWLLFAHVHTAVAPTVAGLALAIAAAIRPDPLPYRLARASAALLLLFWSAGWPGLELALAVLPLLGTPLPHAATPPVGVLLPPDRPLAALFFRSVVRRIGFFAVAAALLATGWALVTQPPLRVWLATTWPERPFSADSWLTLITRPGVWTLWPLWFVALWPNRLYTWWRDPMTARLGLATLLTAGVVLTTFPIAESTPLLLTPVLALAATARLLRFGPGTLAAFAWFSVMLTLFLVVVALLVASAQWLGWPPGLARFLVQTRAIPLVADPQWRLPVALAAIAAWALLIWRLPRQVVRAASHWLLSVVLLWGLILLLLFPWLDGARNVAPTLTTLAEQPVVGTHRCLAPHPTLGVDVVAALRYYLPDYDDPDCPLTLVRLRVATLDEERRNEWQRWAVARAVRREGKRAEWWLVLPKGAAPLAQLPADQPIEE